MDVRATSNLGDLSFNNAVFFSAHVFQRVPDPTGAIRVVLERLKPGGWFVAFKPNGALPWRAAGECDWYLVCKLDHPDLLDEVLDAKCLGTPDPLSLSALFP